MGHAAKLAANCLLLQMQVAPQYHEVRFKKFCNYRAH